MEIDDWQLLSDYANRNSEEAFRTLVDRYACLAYRAALLRGGSPHQAEEITQAVFIALARKAGRIPRGTVLSGWIFRAARFAAANQARQEKRRQHYEQEAAMSHSNPGQDDTESIWDQISPHLYDALEKLSNTDRDALLIRFFQNKSHKELAQALGVSEDAAKARVSRAVERLRLIFAKAGLVTPSAALTATLAAHAAPMAPPGLTASVTTAAMKSISASSALSAATWTQSKAIIGGAAALLAVVSIATITVRAVNTQVNNVIGQLEKQSGEIVVCENSLNLPVTLNIKDLTLPEALDRFATRAGAYWSVDYAVYKSKSALERLEDGLRQASPLEAVGWTNLSHAPHTASPMMVPHVPGNRFSMAIRQMPNSNPERITMLVDLNPDLSEKWFQRPFPHSPSGAEAEPSDAVKILGTATKEGEAEGVLVPERLLAENDLVAKIRLASPVEASASNAMLAAKQAGAHWVKIYTLRKSPLDGCGIRLIHAGLEDAYGQSKPPRRFELSTEDRDAHAQAVEAYLHKKASN